MRIRLRLSEEDAQRLEVPRDLEFDTDKLMGRDLIALEEEAGWDIDRLDQAMAGEPTTNAVGQPVWETDAKGKVVLVNGKPVQARGLKMSTLLVIAWIAARRSGYKGRYAEFDFCITAAEFESVEEPGKGPASPTTTTTGKPRSRRSSASSRGSSATA